MRYAGIIKNDLAAAPGVCVSFYVQGCPHHCPGCFNPETWDFNGGKKFSLKTIEELIQAIGANGIQRNLCILGGEPLCDENKILTLLIIKHIKDEYPDIKIYIWSGYTIEELINKNDNVINEILKQANTLVDGRFELDKRNLKLPMRGSENQRIIDLTSFKN